MPVPTPQPLASGKGPAGRPRETTANRANYTMGKLADKTVRVLLDTGASVSLVSARVYYSLADRPKLQPAGATLWMADGSPMRVHEIADFKLQLGDQCTRHAYTVADIEPDVIVGIDFLAKYRCEWRWSDNSLVIDGKLVPLGGRAASRWWPGCRWPRVWWSPPGTKRL